MAEQKRFYWLKLKSDFFKRHDIRIVESMPDGKEYVLFYLKLLCESVDHDGSLRFNDEIPYTEEMLATITGTDIDIVKGALKAFESLKIITKQDDGTLYMAKVEKMTGYETEWAQKKREFRKRKQEEEDNKRTNEGQQEDKERTNEGQKKTLSDKSKRESERIEIEKEQELETEQELEIELERDIDRYQRIADMYNDTCVSYPRITVLSFARKKAIRARLRHYKVEDFQTLFLKAEDSRFLKGDNPKNWSATFDWLIKDANMAKVLDGNYDDKIGRDVKSEEARKLDDFYRMTAEWAEGGING